MSIYLDKKNRKNKEKATEVARNIIYTTVEDIAKTVYEAPKQEAIVIDLDNTLMANRGVSMEEIKEKLEFPASIGATIRSRGKKIYVKPKKEENLRKLLNKVVSNQIKGVSGINRVLVAEERGEWVIRTDGSNLSKVLDIKGIDPTRTITNHVHEIAKTLGIEAARNSLVKEALSVLEEQGLDVDIRHIMLVADIMTSKGEVRQIGRHGISGAKSSVLARAAFEITVPNIVDAAIKGKADPLQGVTENVIVGQSIPIGTGLVNLYMSTLKGKQEKNE
jgi:DNA-directed RNA polymerase subunit A''